LTVRNKEETDKNREENSWHLGSGKMYLNHGAMQMAPITLNGAIFAKSLPKSNVTSTRGLVKQT
jgi:hypothetical protein